MPWTVRFEGSIYSNDENTELDDISMTIDNEYGEITIHLGNLQTLSDEQLNHRGELYNEVTISNDLSIEFLKNKISITIGLNTFDIKGLEYEIRDIYNFIKTMHSMNTVPNNYVEETRRHAANDSYLIVKSKPFYLHAPHEKGNVGGTGGARKKKTRKTRRYPRFSSVKTSYSRRR